MLNIVEFMAQKSYKTDLNLAFLLKNLNPYFSHHISFTKKLAFINVDERIIGQKGGKCCKMHRANC